MEQGRDLGAVHWDLIMIKKEVGKCSMQNPAPGSTPKLKIVEVVSVLFYNFYRNFLQPSIRTYDVLYHYV